MQDPLLSSEKNFLMLADESAQFAWANSVKASAPDPIEGELLVGALKHPFLRHLMELYLNNSVTSLGSAILVRCGFAEIHEFRVREKWCRGIEIGTVDLNKKGLTCFEKLQGNSSEKAWFETLVDGITCYASRDAGEGICLGREHLATALENQDAEILHRVVQPMSIDYSLWDLEFFDVFTDEARLATEEYWSPNFRGHSAAKVHTSIFEFSRPRWAPEDENGIYASSDDTCSH